MMDQTTCTRTLGMGLLFLFVTSVAMGCADSKQTRQNTLLRPMDAPDKSSQAADSSVKVWPDKPEPKDEATRGLLAKSGGEKRNSRKSGPASEWSKKPEMSKANDLNPPKRVGQGLIAADGTPTKSSRDLPGDRSGPPIDPNIKQAGKSVPAAAEQISELRAAIQKSLKFYEDNPKFSCRVTRQEKVGSKIEPIEVMSKNFRAQPLSVYYKWLDESNTGRECLYVEGQNEGKILTIGGSSDLFFRGKMMSVSPDGYLVRRNSRYPITESSPSRMLQKALPTLDRLEKGDALDGTIEHRGIVSEKEYEKPLIWFHQVMSQVADKAFPKGGIRDWYLDSETYRLVMLKSTTLTGEFEEYYLFDQFRSNPSLSDEDFDPRKLWPSKFKAETKSNRRKNADGKD